jgi:phosphatidylinositol alpha-1,6-mannosyltransferase
MRILLLSSVEHQSGSALRFRGLAGALARAGHETHLLEPAPPGEPVETPPGVRRHPCPRLPGAPEIQAPLWLLHGLAAVRRVRPDVAWALKGLPNVWLAARAARRIGARVAVDLDDLDYAYYPAGLRRRIVERFFRRAAAGADDITVHNEPMRRLVGEIRGPGREAVFVDQGVEVERFTAARERSAAEGAELRARWGLGEGPVLLYGGHLGPASNLAPLLPALAPIGRERPAARLLVVGDGRDRSPLEALAHRTLPEGFAVFAGAVPHRDVPRYYGLADVALNYLEDDEANPYRASIKVREALAAGIPVVTSRTPDTERFADWVRIPDEPGPAAFVEAVRSELRAPDVARAEAGRRWLVEHGTHDAAVRDLLTRWEARALRDRA